MDVTGLASAVPVAVAVLHCWPARTVPDALKIQLSPGSSRSSPSSPLTYTARKSSSRSTTVALSSLTVTPLNGRPPGFVTVYVQVTGSPMISDGTAGVPPFTTLAIAIAGVSSHVYRLSEVSTAMPPFEPVAWAVTVLRYGQASTVRETTPWDV